MSNPTLMVYNNMNHPEDFVLQSDGVDVPDLSSITRMTIPIGGITVDSDDYPDAFDLSQTVSAAEAKAHPEVTEGSPKVVFDFGAIGLVAGTYTGCLLRVYDPNHPLGIPWERFDVVVV